MNRSPVGLQAREFEEALKRERSRADRNYREFSVIRFKFTNSFIIKFHVLDYY